MKVAVVVETAEEEDASQHRRHGEARQVASPLREDGIGLIERCVRRARRLP